MSLQTDDGRLKCLPHPGEHWACEKFGLTLGQASERGRLYRETFYVCRNCGREGETIQRQDADDSPYTFSVRGAMKWCWAAAGIVVPPLVWMRWWWAAVGVGGWLLVMPGHVWWENRKEANAVAARGFPHADAPGRFPSPGRRWD